MASRSLLLLPVVLLSLSIPDASQSGQAAQQSSKTDSASQQPNKQQPQAKQDKEVVYESATVLRAVTRLVVVDVVATDGSGAPIGDLKQEDFTILENDRPQEIRAFSFQHPPASGAPVLRETPVTLQPNVFTNVPSYKAETALSVLLLDALNTKFANQAYARSQMIKYLEKIPEGRPIAVFLLNTRLRMLQDFSSDPKVLKNVIKNLKGGISPVLDNPAGGTDQELLPPGLVDAGVIPADMVNAIQQFENERVAAQTDLRVRYTLDAMNSLARMLSGYPGRKNLIWVSEAFPLSIDPDLTLSVGSFDSMRTYAPEVAETAEHLVDAQVAVYPVDARGLVTSSVLDASSTGYDKMGRTLSRGGRMGQAINQEMSQLAAVHSTMDEIAERSGGKAFYNRNDLDKAIHNSIEDGSTYYTLAYYPANKDWNGKFRKIRVKVDRPGVKLRYRLGYYAVDPKLLNQHDQKRESAVFGQALNLDYPVSTALRFHAGIVQPAQPTKNKVLVNFGIDPHAISFERQDDGLQHATVDCAVQAYTEKGKLVKTEASTVNAQLKPETFIRVMETVFPCQDYIDLPPGNYVLRLGVMDHNNGLMGTTNARITVSAPAPTAMN